MKLKENKIYILPTKEGILTILVTFIGFIISLSFANPLAISCSLFLLTTLLLSAFLTHQQLLQFDHILTPSEIVGYQKTPLLINFRLQSKWRNSASEMLSLSIPQTSSRCTFSVDKNETKNLTMSLNKEEVGISTISHIVLSSTFPFAIFKAWIIYPCNCQCYIAPSPIGKMPLPLSETGHHSEQFTKHLIQNGDELYHEHRPYRQGDSWRRVDWIRHNNSNILLTKSYNNFRDESYNLSHQNLIDIGLNSAESFHQLASWIDECYKKNLRFSLQLMNTTLESASGYAQWKKSLKLLASAAPERLE